MTLMIVREVLGGERRADLLSALTSDDLEWAASADLGFAGRGAVMQLLPKARDADVLQALRPVLAASFYRCLPKGMLPEPAALDVNLFPVIIDGQAVAPPYQLPHRDHSVGGRDPLMTCVYYVQALDVKGGELLALPAELGLREDVDWDELRRVAESATVPEEDAMVMLPGAQLHAVAPLYAGRRVSVVCNYFARAK